MLEIINAAIERGRIRHALFDFDGTISLLREGWQQIMIPLMVEWLQATPGGEDEHDLTTTAADYVTRSTGIQTIYQMLWLVDEIARRGGQPAPAQHYKEVYVARLWEHIKSRVAALEYGRLAPDDVMVAGARAMLDELRKRAVRCYLASGTDEPFVRREAAALRVDGYFAGIYGARDDYRSFSKKILIDRIIAENHLAGAELVVFGDGFVEIEDGKSVQSIAVGVASNEAMGQGVDAWKRARLIEAGADIIIPDFRDSRALAAYLFAEE